MGSYSAAEIPAVARSDTSTPAFRAEEFPSAQAWPGPHGSEASLMMPVPCAGAAAAAQASPAELPSLALAPTGSTGSAAASKGGQCATWLRVKQSNVHCRSITTLPNP